MVDDSWLEKIRLRIMQEAYNFADDDNREAYNAIKVMCNDVLNMIQEKREWVGLTDAEVESWRGNYDFFDSALVREVEAKLKEKNGG